MIQTMSASSPHRDEAVLTVDINVEDLLLFLTWLEHADKAFQEGHPLPDAPCRIGGTASRWVNSIQSLDTHHRRAQIRSHDLTETLRAQEKPLRSFASNLYENLAALYEQLGQRDKAQAVRMRAAALHIC